MALKLSPDSTDFFTQEPSVNCALLYVLVEPVQWPFIIASFDP